MSLTSEPEFRLTENLVDLSFLFKRASISKTPFGVVLYGFAVTFPCRIPVLRDGRPCSDDIFSVFAGHHSFLDAFGELRHSKPYDILSKTGSIGHKGSLLPKEN